METSTLDFPAQQRSMLSIIQELQIWITNKFCRLSVRMNGIHNGFISRCISVSDYIMQQKSNVLARRVENWFCPRSRIGESQFLKVRFFYISIPRILNIFYFKMKNVIKENGCFLIFYFDRLPNLCLLLVYGQDYDL